MFYPGIPGIPPTPPFDPTTLIIDIVAFIAQLLGLGRQDLSAITDAINGTWNNFVVGASFLYNAIAAITDFFKKLLAVLVGGIAHILSDILHGHLKAVLQDIQALLHALHNLFAPLLAWLHKLQAIQRQYQLQTLRRFVNMIQRVRQILVVFRLLHLKFATKLDNWLAGIEGKIISRELEIARKTNEIVGWIDILTDPTGTLRHHSVGGPLWTFVGALGQAGKAIGAAKLLPQLDTTPVGTVPRVPWDTFVTRFEANQLAPTGTFGLFDAGVRGIVERVKAGN